MDVESFIRSQLEALAELWITEVEPVPREYSTSENRWVHVAERAWCDAAGRHPWEEPPGWRRAVREATGMAEGWDAVVYCLVAPDGEIVYVGQTCNLPNRLTTHAQRFRELVTDIDVYRCSNREKARELESALILKHSPRFNVAGVRR